jgi:Putative auto-transporter adhesin, head GIN domain
MKTTRRNWAPMGAAILLGLALTGCGDKGSGKAGTDTRSVGSFDEVEVRGALEVDITVGSGPRLTLSGDDNLLSKVESTVTGDRLIIRPRGSMVRSLPLKATIEVPSLVGLDLHGASEGTVRGIAGSKFSFGAHGASTVTLIGTVDELDIDLHGASKVDARKVAAKKVRVGAAGASTAELGTHDEITAKLSGASGAKYDGSPKVSETVSGASSITKR